MRKSTVAATIVALSAAFASEKAHALAITGGETQVEVTNLFGLTPSLSGTASLVSAEPLTVSFPITGGSLDDLTGQLLIEHDGSGVTLSDGTNSATAGNFLIDTAQGAIFGDVFDISTGLADIADLRVFDFGAVGSDGVQLLISAEFGAGLGAIFGADPADLIGAEFGIGVPMPEFADASPVPVPPALALLATGVAALTFAGRRRRAA